MFDGTGHGLDDRGWMIGCARVRADRLGVDNYIGATIAIQWKNVSEQGLCGRLQRK